MKGTKEHAVDRRRQGRRERAVRAGLIDEDDHAADAVSGGAAPRGGTGLDPPLDRRRRPPRRAGRPAGCRAEPREAGPSGRPGARRGRCRRRPRFRRGSKGWATGGPVELVLRGRPAAGGLGPGVPGRWAVARRRARRNRVVLWDLAEPSPGGVIDDLPGHRPRARLQPRRSPAGGRRAACRRGRDCVRIYTVPDGTLDQD